MTKMIMRSESSKLERKAQALSQAYRIEAYLPELYRQLAAAERHVQGLRDLIADEKRAYRKLMTEGNG